ncbi:MAG TPA: AAA family ATPase [bacterium]|nr:AAA family ATPase [bacterium]
MPSLFLSGIRRIPPSPDREEFPWSVPLFRDLAALEFQSPVTFLVGENGSGKSTLLEALAVGMHAVAVGRAGLDRDETLAGARALAGAFRFVRRRHPAARLFLRAEDVFGCTRRIAGEIVELRATEDDLTRDLPAASAARAAGAVARERLALERRYGADPDARSHGETFLSLLETRLAPRGLYFLDEPEAPLSPVRVLALIALLKDRVAQDCQFIIATHSPILMACPDAEILVLDDARIRRVPYDDLEHVRLTREVLNDPDVFLRRL